MTTGARLLRNMASGGVSGAVATLPMTALMEAGHRMLPRAEQYPLPPREITDQLTEQVTRNTPIAAPAEEQRRVVLTLVAHFGYGAATGAVYGVTSAASVKGGASRGLLFGLLVWTVSYLGFLPALGVLSSATHHPWRRNMLMIAAHVVWGVTMGVLTAALRRPQDATSAMSTTSSSAARDRQRRASA